MIDVGVVGAGFVAAQHVEALRRIPGVRVALISASTPASAGLAAARLGVDAASDTRAIVDDPSIQVVHICTPNDSHVEVALAALAAGKHVVCEKPLAVDASQARAVARAAALTDRLTVLCHNYRFYPMVAELRARALAGALGRIHTIRGQYLQDWLLLPTDGNWRLDPAKGGRSRAVADIGTHWIDLAEILIGTHLEAVLADLRTVVPRRVSGSRQTFTSGAPPAAAQPDADWYDVTTEDEAALLLRFGGGVAGRLSVSQVAAGHKNDLQVSLDGESASATWRQERPDALWLGHRDRPNETLERGTGADGAGASLARLPAGHPEGWADGLRNLFAAAYGVIRGDSSPDELPIPLPTFEDGYRHQLAVEAALESSVRGAWVTIAGTEAAVDAAGRAAAGRDR